MIRQIFVLMSHCLLIVTAIELHQPLLRTVDAHGAISDQPPCTALPPEGGVNLETCSAQKCNEGQVIYGFGLTCTGNNVCNGKTCPQNWTQYGNCVQDGLQVIYQCTR
mmetsp:Transcript_104345/g.185539  ORF Transcript_104345/g.185539 Transcript_104345/m.185539 type:complete len:108 (-) Transcript_104345:13-336(-)